MKEPCLFGPRWGSCGKEVDLGFYLALVQPSPKGFMELCGMYMGLKEATIS